MLLSLPTMPVHLNFAFTFQDYFNAQKLHAKSSWWLRLNLFLAQIGLPILGVSIILFMLWAFRFIDSLPLVLFEFGIGLFLSFYPFYFRLRMKRCYNRILIGSGERTYDFDDSKILLEEANAKSEILWPAVRSFAEDKDSFLIYLAPAKLIMVPKRVCSEPQLSELREMCRRNIPARA